MRTKLFGTIIGAIGLVATVSSARAQSYSIDWFTFAGGGGTSTGRMFSVSGTIGQPDAGTMSGGNFTIDGGFWAIIVAVQTPGAPMLRVFLTSTNTVAIAWPASAIDFLLQQNSALGITNWTAVTSGPVWAGNEKQVIISVPAGNHYYRLIEASGSEHGVGTVPQ